MITRSVGRRAALVMLAAALWAGPVWAQGAPQERRVKIGVLSDMSGPYAEVSGANGILAIEMAVEDLGIRGRGWTVEIVSGDHQNKPDIGANLARSWIDNDRVDAVVTTGNSAIALAVNNIAREKNVAMLNSGAASTDLTGKACTPNLVSFSFDTYMLAHGTGQALTKAGGDTWFFIAADYAFGHAMQSDLAQVVTENGGRVLGGVRHPLGTLDYSSFLLQAQGSGAKVIGLANASGDTINTIKQAAEFGVTQGGQKLAALLMLINDIHALGLKDAKGLSLTESFYWDLNEGTRAWSKRFQARARGGVMPSMGVAGGYAVVLHYLKAIEALGANPRDGAKVVARMKDIPAEDSLFGRGAVRRDGRRLMSAYLFEVKSPEESKYPWDYYKVVATLPAEDVAVPLARSECPLVR